MASESSSLHNATETLNASSASWLHSRAFWAGVSIITMWLAVLFVGVFGGDFISTRTDRFTKIPVVVFLIPFVLPATIAVARRGFTSAPDERRDSSEETPAHEQPKAEATALRAKHA